MTASIPHALGAREYTDPAVFETEKHKIFFRTWQFAVHSSCLPEPGAYQTFDICDQALFCVRDHDGRIRTFHNVCMHRAHRLVEGSGIRKTLVCPYHAWSYNLDGRLKRAPNQHKVAGFDASRICLTEVKTEVLLGFVFVNLDPQAAPMSSWYPNLEAELFSFVPEIDDLAPMTEVSVDEYCNWKVTVENYSECYHCRLNHRTFVEGVVDPDSYNVMPQGHCLRHTTRSANLERLSYPIDPLANEYASAYSSWFLWPSFSFQVYPGNMLNTYHFQPQSVDRTRAVRGWFSPAGAHSSVVAQLAEQDRATTVAEDVRLVESVQKGLNSLGYKPGPLILDVDNGVNSEHPIKALYDWREQDLARS
ncbi:MAG: (2Fe-2S)-binding protein [Thiotrichales bacterium]|nr:(2Fe-2S)-binding protein [Thiotrichales bacterium]